MSDPGGASMPGLEFLKLHVVLEAESGEFELPGLPTLAVHGAIARAFRSMACGSGEPTCERCDEQQRAVCPYWEMFAERSGASEVEVPGSSGAMPRPYFLSLGDQAMRVGADAPYKHRALSFQIGLVGTAVRLYPLFVYALQHGCKDGMGVRRTRYAVREVSSLDPAAGCMWHMVSRDGRSLAGEAAVIDERWFKVRADTLRPSGVTVEFLTPLRIKESGSLANTVRFSVLVRGVLRRLHGLRAYSRDPDSPGLEGIGFERPGPGMLDLARTVESDLAWVDCSRYSTSQKAWMKFGGLVGRVEFEDVPLQCVPLLLAGEFLHIGKQVTFGLGQVRCVWRR